MSYISLSWVVGQGEDSNGGSKDRPSVDKIMEYLERILKNSGSITLDIIDGPEIGPQSLQVEAEGGNAVISLGEDDGDEYIVRTYTNKLATDTDEDVTVLGNLWDSKLICEDADELRGIVKEFVATGTVSQDKLSE